MLHCGPAKPCARDDKKVVCILIILLFTIRITQNTLYYSALYDGYHTVLHAGEKTYASLKRILNEMAEGGETASIWSEVVVPIQTTDAPTPPLATPAVAPEVYESPLTGSAHPMPTRSCASESSSQKGVASTSVAEHEHQVSIEPDVLRVIWHLCSDHKLVATFGGFGGSGVNNPCFICNWARDSPFAEVKKRGDLQILRSGEWADTFLKPLHQAEATVCRSACTIAAT
jgi:hypothetical protein